MIFTVNYDEIIEKIDSIDPIRYAQSRNFINGAVTKLSPYISRGVISTKMIVQRILKRGFTAYQAEKIIQELTWRDYWQEVLNHKPFAVNTDLKNPQQKLYSHKIPKAIVNASTGIEAVDNGIRELYDTGYMHNHLRMYTAAITCNIVGAHWHKPSEWMYYYLADADVASNALSWQWVAGTNSSKPYYANQENINKYCFTDQRSTFLDVSYEELPSLPVPEVLKEQVDRTLLTTLPAKKEMQIDSNQPAFIYNFYNLDPNWRKDTVGNRILLLEPSHFEQYPVCGKTIDLILRLAANIPDIKIFVGEFGELKKLCGPEIFYKQHPLFTYYTGIADQRETIFDVKGYYPSFFAYWKQCLRKMKSL